MQVIKGKGRGENENPRRHIAQALHQTQAQQIAQAGAQQGGKSPGPRAGGANPSQSKGGVAGENLAAGQHRPQDKPPGTLRRLNQHRRLKHHLPLFPKILPELAGQP